MRPQAGKQALLQLSVHRPHCPAEKVVSACKYTNILTASLYASCKHPSCWWTVDGIDDLAEGTYLRLLTRPASA